MSISCSPEDVFSSAYAAGLYLNQNGYTGQPVLVVGEEGLTEELREAGIRVVRSLREAPTVDYVVVGTDESLSYQKLVDAHKAIVHGAAFIATNRDTTYPTEDGTRPGGGAIVAAIAASVNQEPVVTGKPSPFLLDRILERANARPEDVLLIGDRLETDILFGKQAGLCTVLVLTGISTREEAAVAPAEMQPDWILEDLTKLPALLTGE